MTACCELCGKCAFFILRKTEEKQTEPIGGWFVHAGVSPSLCEWSSCCGSCQECLGISQLKVWKFLRKLHPNCYRLPLSTS